MSMDYKKVIKDFNNGIIDKNTILFMDNDSGYWSPVNDKITKSLNEKYGTPGGLNDIVGVLQAAGVNAQWC